MALSDNGLALGKEIIKWATAAVTVLGGVLTLWIQAHYQHQERIDVEREKVVAIQEQTKAIKTAIEDKRPLVFAPAGK